MQTLYMGNENNKIIYFDNFLANPDILVEAAAQSRFTPYPAATQRKGYPGLRTAAPAVYGELLRSSVVDVVRHEFSIPSDSQLSMLQEAMCLMTLPASALGPLQTIPHFDTSNPHFFAALLYLCGEEHGGTGFYRHNATGYEAITPERCDTYLDTCHDEFNNHRREKRYFSESDRSPTAWPLESLIYLKLSISINKSAIVFFLRLAKPKARVNRSVNKERLASPVSASCWAMCIIFFARVRASLTSWKTITAPLIALWRSRMGAIESSIGISKPSRRTNKQLVGNFTVLFALSARFTGLGGGRRLSASITENTSSNGKPIASFIGHPVIVSATRLR